MGTNSVLFLTHGVYADTTY